MSQKPSVLVVDDESGILDTLRILLRNEGFEVTTAQGGKAGLEQIRSGAHDIAEHRHEPDDGIDAEAQIGAGDRDRFVEHAHHRAQAFEASLHVFGIQRLAHARTMRR